VELPFELDRPLVFFDLETTGLTIGEDRIVEMALIKLLPSGDVLERVRRFNPEMPIPAEASAVHGIRDEDVADEEPFSRRARALAELLDGCDLAGFNVRRFDVPFLVGEFRRVGVPFSVGGRRVIDMQTIFHREEPRDLSAAARFYLDREHAEAHTALGDIRTSAAVLSAQLQRYEHLPHSLDDLNAYCEESAPLNPWFRETEVGLIFRRGKHRGLALEDVARQHGDYLEWMLSLDDMDPDIAQLLRRALDQAGV